MNPDHSLVRLRARLLAMAQTPAVAECLADLDEAIARQRTAYEAGYRAVATLALSDGRHAQVMPRLDVDANPTNQQPSRAPQDAQDGTQENNEQ